MLTKLLIALIVGTLLWLAIKRQVEQLLDRPEMRAFRDVAAQTKQANRARTSSASRQGSATAGRSGTKAPEVAVTLVACEVCAVHTPEQRLHRDDQHPRGICPQCLASR